MTISVRIEGHDHPNSGIIDVKVTRLGAMVTAPFSYDDTVFKELAEDDTAYNFYSPKAGQQFVVTGIRAKADRQVSGVNDATVIIYEASSVSSLTVDNVIHQEAMVQGESITLLPINILVAEGKWINAKTTDDDIHMSIMGYYVPSAG